MKERNFSCCAGNSINAFPNHSLHVLKAFRDHQEYNKLWARKIFSLFEKQTNLCYCYNLWYYVGRHISKVLDTFVKIVQRARISWIKMLKWRWRKNSIAKMLLSGVQTDFAELDEQSFCSWLFRNPFMNIFRLKKTKEPQLFDAANELMRAPLNSFSTKYQKRSKKFILFEKLRVKTWI